MLINLVAVVLLLSPSGYRNTESEGGEMQLRFQFQSVIACSRIFRSCIHLVQKNDHDGGVLSGRK